MGQTLSAGSVGAASQWHHLRAGWAAPLPVSPCASLCSLCCSAVAREAGAGRPVRPRHRVAGERRGVFLSDAAERGRGATFDNAPFQIRRKPSKAGALGRRGLPLCCVRCSAMAARESRDLFSLASRSRGQARAQWCFVFVLSHVVYSAAPTTPSSPWLRVDATLLGKNPTPNPLISASGPAAALPRGSPAPPAAIVKSQNDLAVVGTRQETDGSPRGSP